MWGFIAKYALIWSDELEKHASITGVANHSVAFIHHIAVAVFWRHRRRHVSSCCCKNLVSYTLPLLASKVATQFLILANQTTRRVDSQSITRADIWATFHPIGRIPNLTSSEGRQHFPLFLTRFRPLPRSLSLCHYVLPLPLTSIARGSPVCTDRRTCARHTHSSGPPAHQVGPLRSV